jgi:uncharacterized membrane protein YphA (DoxX/SURF4 family)
MYTLAVLGYIIFGGYFIYSGFNHFRNLEMLTGYAKSKHVMMPRAAVAITGVLMMIGGFLILTRLSVPVGSILVLIFLIPTTYQLHQFWKIADPAARMTESIHFSKNVALIAALLILLGM